MKNLLDTADQIPVTLVVAIAYVTLAILTDPFAPSGKALFAFGALTPIAVADGDAWRLLASAFLHGGILHLGLNTYALLLFGPQLERALGSMRFAALYVVAALGGSLAVCIAYPPRGMVVGGSGALFGMMGAALAWQMRQGRTALAFLDHQGPRQLIGMIVANLVIGFLIPMVSNTAHVGGLIAGFALTLLFLLPARPGERARNAWRLVVVTWFAGALLWALQPTTRWDWLWNRAVALQHSDPQRAERLRDAALRSYFGHAQISSFDRAAFEARELAHPDETEDR